MVIPTRLHCAGKAPAEKLKINKFEHYPEFPNSWLTTHILVFSCKFKLLSVFNQVGLAHETKHQFEVALLSGNQAVTLGGTKAYLGQ